MQQTKKERKGYVKYQKGITLISLITTIVILLILAGVGIGMLNAGGLIEKANEAKRLSEKKDIETQIGVMVVESVSTRGDIDKEKLKEKLNGLPDGKEIVDNENEIYVIYPEYVFAIDVSTGKIGNPQVEIVEDTTPWELAGEGTEASPYLIESIEDLVAFSNSVNNGTDYYSKYVKLVNNLDFNLPFSYDNYKTKVSEKTNRIITEDASGTEIKTFLTTGTGFNPIGSESYYFKGNFDGNGKTIKNIYINRPDEDYVALFGSISQSIKNIGLEGNITGKDSVAGFVRKRSK